MTDTPTREDAWTLLTEYTDNPSLIKHALAVEAAMRAYAEHFGEDVESWGIIGLIHDFDYQQNPTEETHVHVGIEILRERGLAGGLDPRPRRRTPTTWASRATPSSPRRSSRWMSCSGFSPRARSFGPTRPSPNVKVKSVKKKLKDKAFARASTATMSATAPRSSASISASTSSSSATPWRPSPISSSFRRAE